MAEVTLDYDTVVTTVLAGKKLTRYEEMALRSSFGNKPITRRTYQLAMPMILCAWPKKKLERCMKKADRKFLKAEKRHKKLVA